MKFIADLHIHSHFSRATAKNLDIENIYIAAQLKGITVVATGDFTHPGWFAEIKEKLVPAEEGLFKLKDEIADKCDRKIPLACRGTVRFMLVSEISSIYKKDNKTRKIHNLVFFPALDLAEKFNSKLDKIGNIKSDGRPILGLDARNLLEILLNTSDEAFLIPAHIWTPWFSLFGSKSGFDSIEECFEDLSAYIFAVETGLSSDPAMNRQVSGLDGLTLVSNSDAHSPLKLGREANIFNTELAFKSIKSALETGSPNRFLGTFEFYPEEGKYHLDGHRKCDIRLWPEETRKLNGICSVCNKPLTLGVLYRVEELADRPEGIKPARNHPFYSIIPLVEVLSEVLRVGPGSKKVMGNYHTLLEKLGPEFNILNKLNIKTIEKAGGPLLGEAIARMRRNDVDILPGYDGEFGTIKIFNQNEREKLLAQKTLFTVPALGPPTKKKPHPKKIRSQKTRPETKTIIKKTTPTPQKKTDKIDRSNLGDLNPEQRQAVEHQGGPLMIIAGPGTGKTFTLTQRIARLVLVKGVLPQNILAVTFTNKAAKEMQHRLAQLTGSLKPPPFIGTFHGLCFKLLKEHYKKQYTIIDDHDRKSILLDAIKLVERSGMRVAVQPQGLLDGIIAAKQLIIDPQEDLGVVAGSEKQTLAAVYKTYQKLLSIQGLCDYEDLIFKTAKLFRNNQLFIKKYQDLFRFIFVDEYQDLNYGQYCIVTSLAPPAEAGQNVFVIGDPDQSIYGFRGSDIKHFKKFIKDYPDAAVIKLLQNYRSAQTILDASYQVITAGKNDSSAARISSRGTGAKHINIVETASERAEAVAVGKAIEQSVGGTGFHSLDFGHVTAQHQTTARSFSDFAVLFRTAAQGNVFADVFEKAGIPCQVVNRDNVLIKSCAAEWISLLKTIEGSGSLADLERVAKPKGSGVSKKSMEIFKQWCYQNSHTLTAAMFNARRFPVQGMSTARQIRLNGFLDTLEAIKKQSEGMSLEKKLLFLAQETRPVEALPGDAEKREVLNHLIEIAQTCDDEAEFLATTALQTDTDLYTHQVEKVALMTMHAAKGLEFPVVFIVGCEDGFVPLRQPGTGRVDLEEERRLFYVAMTRAKEQLYLTFAGKRRIYGKQEKRTPSPFVADIEARLRTHAVSAAKTPPKKGPSQLKLF
jgi:DNA helicase-2/ATP-dependent DNA helicase PcrA